MENSRRLLRFSFVGTDTPEIVIRTAEEREAEEAATEASRTCVAEILNIASGCKSLTVGRKAQIEKETGKFLSFQEYRDAITWASLRAKELSCEGVEIYTFPPNADIKATSDKRVTAPLEDFRYSAQARMLKW